MMQSMISRLSAERQAREQEAREQEARETPDRENRRAASFEAGRRWAAEVATERELRTLERAADFRNPSPAASIMVAEIADAAVKAIGGNLDPFAFREGALAAWSEAKGQL